MGERPASRAAGAYRKVMAEGREKVCKRAPTALTKYGSWWRKQQIYLLTVLKTRSVRLQCGCGRGWSLLGAVPEGCVPAPLPGCLVPVSSLRLFSVHACVQISSSYKDTSHIG